MISGRVLEALNRQMNREFHAAYLYLGMASYLEERGLSGMARWMRKQAEEELKHAMKFYDYIHDRGGHVELYSIDAVPTEYGSVLEVFRRALEHEKAVTRHIYELVDLARMEGDRATESFLKWFVDEQVEEEKIFAEIVQLLEFAGEEPQTLLILDSRLGERRG